MDLRSKNEQRDPDPSNEDDRQRAARLRKGEVEALREIYDRHSAGVYALCTRMLKDPQRAEEIMQDTFWQLWAKPEQYDSERGKLSTFLFLVARSRCLDRLRAERSESERIRSAHVELETAPSQPSGPTPLESAIDIEDRSRVRAALDGLRQDYRELVILMYFDGLSQSEIAARTALPLGTVKTRLRRGLLELRQALARGGAQ